MKTKEKLSTTYTEVAPGVWGMKDKFVNVYMVQNGVSKKWVLIDAGVSSSSTKIRRMAQDLFAEPIPKAILLTHGHFDHVGALQELVSHWNAPVYAHRLEFPYLIGTSSYPPADPTVGGGLMSLMSFMYPNSPIDLGGHLHALPDDSSVPGLPEWQYVHTPGHAPGHVSFFRKKDGVLIAGDAFVTTQQESAWAVVTQKKIVSIPPAYFTYDWKAARKSIEKLSDLKPEIVASGHGAPMSGEELKEGLDDLKRNFKKEMPSEGRYVSHGAITTARGVEYLPPQPFKAYLKWAAVGFLSGLLATTMALVWTNRKKSTWSLLAE